MVIVLEAFLFCIALAALFIALSRARSLRSESDKLARSILKALGSNSSIGLESHSHNSLIEKISSEVHALHDSFASLRGRYALIEQIVEQLPEGVMVINQEMRVVLMNPSARTLLKVSPLGPSPKSVEECVPGRQMQEFIKDSFNSEEMAAAEVSYYDGKVERVLKVNANRLSASGMTMHQLLVVFDEVTQLKKLERMRRDFVANVSHELRTPLTAIKASAETLIEGAASEPQSAERFLTIIKRQSERLVRIFEDLLNLSRLELEGEASKIETELIPVEDLFSRLSQATNEALESKGLNLGVTCPPDLSIVANGSLMEQALSNLLENAIKHTEPGGKIELDATLSNGHVRLSVRDNGCGIESKHLSRIFERFYRVDKSRSRAEGGTGLGLAIVKHIAQAHGGFVEVESVPKQGSLFSIALPRV
ncbi:MAG: hypothetical protein DCC75_04555 [Proteobacteria bacterium]|nr:MAG: hypothetical protein DCC75_04555 [Pseudomonadota bacterium]